MRLNHEQKERLKKKYNVDRIWSYSRLSSFRNCPHEYFHNYVLHDIPHSNNVYTVFGTYSHNLIQDLMLDRIVYEDMGIKWKEIVNNWKHDPNAYQFDTEKIENGYVNNLTHYFSHTDVPEGKNIEVEKPVLATIGTKKDGSPKYLFVGYVDTQYIDADGNTVLIDYKTSSRSSFSKDKLPGKSQQLMLYAIAKHQYNHIPYNKIKCRFDMMKYVTVHYKQENGKWNTSIQERSGWVSKMSKRLTTKLKKMGLDKKHIEEMVQMAGLTNSIEKLPLEIQEQFTISNYYIELPINEQNCEELAKKIEDECDLLIHFECMTREQQENYLETNWPYDPDNYYDKKLCAYHTSEQFKAKEKSINDLLEPQLAGESFTDLNDLFTGDSLLAEIF